VPTPALPPHLWGKVGGLKDFVERGNQLNQNYWRFRKNHGFYMVLYALWLLHGFICGFGLHVFLVLYKQQLETSWNISKNIDKFWIPRIHYDSLLFLASTTTCHAPSGVVDPQQPADVPQRFMLANKGSQRLTVIGVIHNFGQTQKVSFLLTPIWQILHLAMLQDGPPTPTCSCKIM
jgi:hypothetical protein